jgi:hypothetical protein
MLADHQTGFAPIITHGHGAPYDRPVASDSVAQILEHGGVVGALLHMIVVVRTRDTSCTCEEPDWMQDGSSSDGKPRRRIIIATCACYNSMVVHAPTLLGVDSPRRSL